MKNSERPLGVVFGAVGIALAAVIAVALAVLGGASAWILALLGGAVLGILVTVGLVALLGVSPTGAYDDESFVDRVTELPNSEKLFIELGEATDDQSGASRHVFTLYLLDGLKTYNDAYGRACGDALLSWLARKLKHAVGDGGRVYRMRGGEFAVLTSGPEATTAEVRATASAALSESGEGFAISASAGEVVVPEEAQTVSGALKLADHRAHADRSTTLNDRETLPPQDVIEAARRPAPRFDVSELARAVGRRMDIPADRLDDLAAAAHLRDIGNMAVPNVVLGHTGSLPSDDWRFIRLHTLVGERLLAANFGMLEVAALVRSSHERWDGQGYPDGLQAEEIPLGSRIVFVCSAFEDMTSTRPHREALDVNAALAELDRGAGSQFDPEIVRAFHGAFSISEGREPRILAAPPWRRLRVLVADDDAASRFLLWRAVEAAGHECVTVEDGERAWETYRAELPDVVICDARLPGLDGDELCRRIREEPEARQTYFVMLAALGDLGRIRRGIRSGADDFLTKPIMRQELDMRLVAAARARAVYDKANNQLAG